MLWTACHVEICSFQLSKSLFIASSFAPYLPQKHTLPTNTLLPVRCLYWECVRKRHSPKGGLLICSPPQGWGWREPDAAAAANSPGAKARVKVGNQPLTRQGRTHRTQACLRIQDGRHSEFLLKNSPSVLTFHNFGKKNFLSGRDGFMILVLRRRAKDEKGFSFCWQGNKVTILNIVQLLRSLSLSREKGTAEAYGLYSRPWETAFAVIIWLIAPREKCSKTGCCNSKQFKLMRVFLNSSRTKPESTINIWLPS